MIFSVSKQKVLSVSVTRTSQRSGKCAFHELLRMSVMRSPKAIGFDELGGRVGDAGHFNRVNLMRAGLQRKKRQQARACAEIHNYIAGLYVR